MPMPGYLKLETVRTPIRNHGQIMPDVDQIVGTGNARYDNYVVVKPSRTVSAVEGDTLRGGFVDYSRIQWLRRQ